MEEKRSDIEKILEERVKLDEILVKEFTRKVTVMFTDIKGSTSFYDQRGNLDGRLMVHRHNAQVVPLIEQNRGRLIKTIGDATMSVYDHAEDAARASVQMQQRLREYNAGRTEGEQINIRIGMNTGMGIVEETDVYGDVVNVASRVEGLADGGEIMVTEETYREVKDNDEFIFRFAESAKVKGKKEALKAYRLLWHEEDLNLGKTRKAPQAHAKKESVFVLDASVADKTIKVSAYLRADGEERTVKNYQEIPYNETKIRDYTKGITDVLNKANRRGKIGNDLLVKLKELGMLLFNELIPAEIKERLVQTGENSMVVDIDDRLVHIPWELLYDGKGFLCQRFNLGRSVSTKQAVSVVIRALHRPLKMQILANPRGDLKAAYEEGVVIKNEISNYEDWIDASLKTTDITTDYAKSKIRNFDIVHYAGHAEHNVEHPEKSGWLLKNGSLTAAEIMTLAGSRPMPSLVFSNACQTGQTDAWKLDEHYSARIFGIANAFLLSGVQHYVGTFWEIPDEAGALFAKSIYWNLVSGATIGAALRHARQSLIDKYGEDTVVWASYMLYGDPTTQYAVSEEEETAAASAAKQQESEPLTAALRGAEQIAEAQWGGKNKAFLMAGAAIVVALVLAVLFFLGKGRGPSQTIVMQPAPSQANLPVRDDASQKRIDELVSTLAGQYRSGKIEGPAKSTDDWSSRIITMVFMDMKTEGSAGGKLVDSLVTRVTQALETEGRVQMVERELLQKLLEELKLSASNLADPATALKIGKLLSARVMVTGSLLPDNKGMAIALRFIDTESSAVRKVMTIAAPSKEIDDATVQRLASGINEWVKADFPVRGRVMTVAGEVCMVNLGKAHGIKRGDRIEIVKEAKKGSGLFAVTGELEVTELAQDKSQARIISKLEPVREGSRVRIKL